MLSEISARNFRCFEHVELTLDPCATILLGRNGQGKTSLIEAACVLLRLQSPRTTARADFIMFGEKAAVVEGVCGGRKLRFAASAQTRRLAVDGAVCGRSAEYLSNTGLVVWMDHSDMNMLRGGAEHRRRYLDFAASQIFPDYLHALRGYDRALRSRNHTLKRDARVNWAQADAYAQVMEVFAATLITHRAELVEALRDTVSATHHALSGGERAMMSYAPGCESGMLCETLRALRADEDRARTTAAGAHRDELKLVLDDRDATTFASEGQQRTCALAMKIAQARVLEEKNGAPPLLLIDDVFGELDRHRRRALLAHLPASSQKIITTTNLDWTEESDVRGAVWCVEAGAVRQ